MKTYHNFTKSNANYYTEERVLCNIYKKPTIIISKFWYLIWASQIEDILAFIGSGD